MEIIPHTQNGPVRADELTWTLAPTPRVEDLPVDDLLALSPTELLAYAADAREDLRAVRLVLQRALALVARQQDQITRAARIVDSQRQQLRECWRRERAA